MTRRLSWALATMAVATFTLFTGVASAQSPPVVEAQVIEQVPELPRTGSSSAIPMTFGAIALLLIGTALVITARRKKGNDPTTA